MGEDDARSGEKPRACAGLLIVNKPSGITSRAVVNRVARLFRRLKVGHAGTLDPLASGVLAVCIGTATRLVEELQRLPKSYRTVFRLGARSDTLDADGRIVEEPCVRVPSADEVESALRPFLGEVVQMPPSYSALKVKGQRAYDLARAGRSVDLAPRSVRIDRIALVAYAWPRVELEIDCGGGTFIRSIARDMGEALACGGLVETLTRTRVGPFELAGAVDAAQLAPEAIERHLRPPLDAVSDLPRIALDPQQLELVAHGRRLAAAEVTGPAVADGRVALVDLAGNLIALGDLDWQSGWLQPRKVLI
jgi:tRNA pseudouridine55 synthase